MNKINTKSNLSLKELAIFAMLGSIIYIQKLILQAFPNIHLVSVLITSYTIVYRKKAIYPIVLFVLIDSVFSGYNIWCLPYIFIWGILFLAVYFIPERVHKKKYAPILYMFICSLNGFLFGTMFAPFNALFTGTGFSASIEWIIAGLPYDLIHGISNFFVGILILPIVKTLRLLNTQLEIKTYERA